MKVQNSLIEFMKFTILAPYISKSFYIENDVNDISFRTNLSEWFKGRGIPLWRDKLDLLLHRLNITAPSELLDKTI